MAHPLAACLQHVLRKGKCVVVCRLCSSRTSTPCGRKFLASFRDWLVSMASREATSLQEARDYLAEEGGGAGGWGEQRERAV